MYLLKTLLNNALSLCFFLFGIWVIWLSHQLKVTEGTELGYDLAFYPGLLGWFILVTSLIILLRQLFLKDGGDYDGLRVFKNPGFMKRVGGSVLLVALYVSFVSIVGYLLLTPIFLFAFICALGNRNFINAIFVSIAITGSIYFLFWILLYIPLPEGLLIPKLMQ